MRAKILIRLKEDVPDSAGRVLQERVAHLGFTDVLEARVGKLVELEFEGSDRDGAINRIKNMCKQVLVNASIEDYEILSVE